MTHTHTRARRFHRAGARSVAMRGVSWRAGTTLRALRQAGSAGSLSSDAAVVLDALLSRCGPPPVTAERIDAVADRLVLEGLASGRVAGMPVELAQEQERLTNGAASA